MSGGGAGAVVRHGYLRKLKTMKRKYFVLRAETHDCSARLEYYESEKKFRSGAVPRRVIPLKTCFNITRRLDLKQRHVIALYTKEDQFCMVAEGEDDLHTWLTDLLKQHHNEDTIEELLHPTQHVWQVNVQKKGLGASKNIIGLYNLCLTDKTLTLVKIKASSVMGEQNAVADGIEFSLKNIRRCGDSECFFYMEVGRQTGTGAGELWMHTDDANIAQSMHSTIYHAMCNCREDKDMAPVTRNRSASATEDPRAPRRSTYGDPRGRSGLMAIEKGLCVGSCIKQCVCSGTHSVDESAQPIAPLVPNNANQTNNPLTDIKDKENRHHHRTASLPTGCFPQEPLKIVHERTRSAPLTGDEVDCVPIEKPTRHSSCKTVNGQEALSKKSGQWSRRASTGTRLSKLSPAHIKNVPAIRNRCDSMPSRTCPPLDNERTPSRHPELSESGDISRDEPDAAADWHRTPRIPEEPDYCEMSPMEIMNMFIKKMSGSAAHSRTSSLVAESPPPAGYLPMAPAERALSASSGSVCSGTPSTDPRFSEYQLEPATAHVIEERPPRAYSVGSRPCPAAPHDTRLRAYSVGARGRARPAPAAPAGPTDDLMELDFTNHSPKTKVIVASTPPGVGFVPPPSSVRKQPPRARVDEYVDMSPRDPPYLHMGPAGPLPHTATTSAPDGYVEMNYGAKRTPSRPISIAPAPPAPRPELPSCSAELPPPSHAPVPSAAESARRHHEAPTPLGSQTLFPLSPDTPASPRHHDLLHTDLFDDEPHHHPLSTVRETCEETTRRSPEVGSPSHYVRLQRPTSQPIAAPPKSSESEVDELSCNPTATKTWAGDPKPPQARFEERKSSSPAPTENPTLNYAALDLEPRSANAPPPARAYTQIDFARSEKMHTADAN